MGLKKFDVRGVWSRGWFKTFSMKFEECLWVFKGSFKEIIMWFKGGGKEVSKVIQSSKLLGCVREATMVCQESLESVPENFIASWEFLKCSNQVSRVFQKSFKKGFFVVVVWQWSQLPE